MKNTDYATVVAWEFRACSDASMNGNAVESVATSSEGSNAITIYDDGKIAIVVTENDKLTISRSTTLEVKTEVYMREFTIFFDSTAEVSESSFSIENGTVTTGTINGKAFATIRFNEAISYLNASTPWISVELDNDLAEFLLVWVDGGIGIVLVDDLPS